MKRNASVELIRIFGCLIVIACHADFYQSLADSAPLLFRYNLSLFSDGVTLFWMICGFFLFQNDRWLPLWKHTLRRIVLPLCMILLFSFFVSPFFPNSNAAFSADYAKTYLFNVITLHTPDEHTEHLWYLFAYLLVILLFPILKKIASFLDRKPFYQILFMIVAFCAYGLNDLSQNTLLSFGFYFLSVLLPSCSQILWGHILYSYCGRLRHKSLLALCPLLLLLNLLRDIANTFANAPVFTLNVWFSSFSLLSATLVIVFCMNLCTYVSLPERQICRLAGHTFGIYIIHPFLMDLLAAIGFWNLLQNRITSYMTGPLALALFMILCVAVTFLLSLLVCLIPSGMKTLLKTKPDPSCQ